MHEESGQNKWTMRRDNTYVTDLKTHANLSETFLCRISSFGGAWMLAKTQPWCWRDIGIAAAVALLLTSKPSARQRRSAAIRRGRRWKEHFAITFAQRKAGSFAQSSVCDESAFVSVRHPKHWAGVSRIGFCCCHSSARQRWFNSVRLCSKRSITSP